MKLMRTRAAVEDEVAAPITIGPDAPVAAIVNHYPQTLHVFSAYGFNLLRSPLARKTVARGVTVSQAAEFRNICADELLVALRTAAGVNPDVGGRACSGCDH